VVYYTTDAKRRHIDWVIEAVKGDRLSAMIRDLRPDTTYYFKVAAVNKAGYGPLSPTAIFHTAYGWFFDCHHHHHHPCRYCLLNMFISICVKSQPLAALVDKPQAQIMCQKSGKTLIPVYKPQVYFVDVVKCVNEICSQRSRI